MVYKFFDKDSAGSVVATFANKSAIKNKNDQLAEELHKPIIRRFERRKLHSSFKDNIWDVHLTDMQLISKFNEGISFLLYTIDIFGKYAWVISLKNEKCVTITNAFQKILDESRRKPNKIWVDKGSEFYNRSMKSWLEKNDTKMYSSFNEGKSIVVERFIRTVKTKIYKCMTSVSKSVYIDKLDDIVNEYNNTYHRTIKMKPLDVKGNAYFDFSKEVNDKNSKFKVGDHARISKYKNIFVK